MWKVYARTRQLMVRTPERAIAPSSQVAAYLVSAVADEPPSAAARVAVEMGLLGPDWIFGADGAAQPASDPDVAKRAIVEARRHRDQPTGQAAGLASFIEKSAQPDTAKLVVFVPGRPGPWLERVVEVARARPDGASCVVVVDGIRAPDEDDPSRWATWLKRPEAAKDEDEARVTTEEFDTVVRTLTRRAGSG